MIAVASDLEADLRHAIPRLLRMRSFKTGTVQVKVWRGRKAELTIRGSLAILLVADKRGVVAVVSGAYDDLSMLGLVMAELERVLEIEIPRDDTPVRFEERVLAGPLTLHAWRAANPMKARTR